MGRFGQWQVVMHVCLACLLAYTDRSHSADRTHLISGRNLSVMRIELLRTFEQMARTFGWDFNYKMTQSLVEINDVQYLSLAATDEASYERIRSATIGWALLDEVALLPHSFVAEVIGRLSFGDSKIVATCNPQGLNAWLWREYIRPGKIDRHVRFGLDDNPTLAAKVKDRYDALYTGHMHDRLVKGQWSDASGRIYRAYTPAIARPIGEAVKVVAGLDYGIKSPTAGVVIAWWPDGLATILSGLYIDGAKRVVTDEYIAERVCEWLQPFGVQVVWADPSASSLINTLRGKYLPVQNANHDVLQGIAALNTALASGQLSVDESPTLDMWREEIGGYVWDEKARDRGIEQPVKINDHMMDATRYAWWSEVTKQHARIGHAPAAFL